MRTDDDLVDFEVNSTAFDQKISELLGIEAAISRLRIACLRGVPLCLPGKSQLETWIDLRHLVVPASGPGFRRVAVEKLC